MKFDGSVNLGNVLTLIAMLSGGFWALSEFKIQVSAIGAEVRAYREFVDYRLARLERWTAGGAVPSREPPHQ